MIFTELALPGAFLVEIKQIGDDRGFFGRSWCAEEFAEHGLKNNICQINTSVSKRKGTIRGMHFQIAPHAETKFIRCTKGSIYDVIIDLRPDSDTFKQWLGTELKADHYSMLYVPEGFAHGFVTLEDDTEVYYPVTAAYHPASERGIRFNDPAFNIEWPVPVTVYSEKDMSHADFDESILS